MDIKEQTCHAEFFPIRPNTTRAMKQAQFHPYPHGKSSSPYTPLSFLLNRCLVRKRGESLRGVVAEGDGAGFTGLGGLTLQVDGVTAGGSLLLQLGVLLYAPQEIVTGTRGRDVLDLDVDSLLDVSTPDLLVDDDTDGGLGDVVDDSGLSVVDLVRHTVELVLVSSSLSSSSRRVRRMLEIQSRIRKSRKWNSSYPFWTAPLTLISTISPTLLPCQFQTLSFSLNIADYTDR